MAHGVVTVLAFGEKRLPLAMAQRVLHATEISAVHVAQKVTEQAAVARGGGQQHLTAKLGFTLDDQAKALIVERLKAIANKARLAAGCGWLLLQQVLIFERAVTLLRRRAFSQQPSDAAAFGKHERAS